MTHFATHSELQAAMAAGAFLFKPAFGPATFACSVCGAHRDLNTSGEGCGTGYGRTAADAFVCYPCGAEQTREDLIAKGKGTLYLTLPRREDRRRYRAGDVLAPGIASLTDWTGKLSTPALWCTVGDHNIARVRYDVRFRLAGEDWHGVTYGDDTQICHVRRLKAQAAKP